MIKCADNLYKFLTKKKHTYRKDVEIDRAYVEGAKTERYIIIKDIENLLSRTDVDCWNSTLKQFLNTLKNR